MASAAAATTEKGSPVVVGLLVVGNIIILLSGLALFAETVWVTADQYRVYPLVGVSGKDDVFAGAWIAIFCGFSFFVVASFGVGAALCRRRSMILTYLILMLIIYIFECASCITSYTHRDYMVSNPSLITKQMLTFYSADSNQGRELTRLWDRIMIEQECCGTSGPMDWVNFTSAFRATTPEVVFPWPPLCCRRTGNFIPVNEEGCRLGHLDYLFTKVCLLLLCLSVCLALSGSSVSFSLPLQPPWALSHTPTFPLPRAALNILATPSTATHGASRGLGLPS
ncbi:Uroplakin-1a [Bos mutus]|uniref:Uroplakin-1a n=1 Tax=Bos mutus TaxID=72004 RepID=L8HV82_9CETA|nr:Uroplakin-1a [Bos mutus]